MIATRPLVLMYHGIADVPRPHDPHNLFVPADAFARQLEILRDAGFQAIDEDTYLAGPTERPTRRTVLITFDDGYVSVLEQAAPILRRMGLPAISYVSAGMIGGVSAESTGDPAYQLMDADQVLELRRYGVDLGVHGWNHGSMPGQDPDALRQQTITARRVLAELTGAPLRTFAYPYGSHDAAARTAVRAAGFAAAFATHDGTGPMAIRRVDINTTDTPRTFRLKLRRSYLAARQVASAVPTGRRLIHQFVGRDRESWTAHRGPLLPG